MLRRSTTSSPTSALPASPRVTLVDWVVGMPVNWDFFAPWESIPSMLIATPEHDLERFGDAAAKRQEQMQGGKVETDV